MLTLKIKYENGEVRHTRINTTEQGAKEYYIGKIFNIGIVSDNLQKCVDIEVLEDDNKPRINNMCTNCSKLGNDCKGTTCQTWTDCIYKTAKIKYGGSVAPLMQPQPVRSPEDADGRKN